MAGKRDEGRGGGSTLGTVVLLTLAVVGAVAKRDDRPASGAADRDKETGRPDAATAAPSAPLPVDHPPGIIGLGRAIAERIGRDNITLVAAGIAFYVMLSIFPALAALVSIYGLVADPADVSRRIADYGSLLPPEALKLITDGLASFSQKSGSQLSLALLTSLVLALWSARAGISAVMAGLNIAYEETEQRSLVVQTAVALAMTLAGLVFAAVVILVLAVVPLALRLLRLDGAGALVFDLARWPILALLMVLGFAFIYRWAPSRSHPRWRWITWGSAAATLLWLIGSFGFSFYVSRFGSYDATYGSLGAVVILLLWLWVSALIMLLGAEIDSELDLRASTTGAPLAGTRPSAGPPLEKGAAAS